VSPVVQANIVEIDLFHLDEISLLTVKLPFPLHGMVSVAMDPTSLATVLVSVAPPACEASVGIFPGLVITTCDDSWPSDKNVPRDKVLSPIDKEKELPL